MNLPSIKTKKGFTIIEVALVLAVGGLIMLMVFIAWPAVQRNQRDSQRRTVDLPRLYTALSNYMTNNSGKLPAVPTSATIKVTGAEDTGSVAGTGANNGNWVTFYKNYMLAEGDTFVDPVGTPYNIKVNVCAAGSTTGKNPTWGLSTGADCTKDLTGGALKETFDEQASTITVVIGASCQGERAVAATSGAGGTRKFAVMYKLESGGTFCQSN